MTKDFALTAALGAIELHLLHHVPGCVYLESVAPVIRAALAQLEQEPDDSDMNQVHDANAQLEYKTWTLEDMAYRPGGLTEEESELKEAVREFFTYLDREEESDGGRMFNPIKISCCRVLMLEPLGEVIAKMKELSK